MSASALVVGQARHVNTSEESMAQETARSTVEDLVQALLTGERTLACLDDLSLQDVISDARLRNCYINSGAKNIREFVALGTRRHSLRNYGKISEQRLSEGLIGLLQRNPKLLASQIPKFDHTKLAMRVIESSRPWTIVSEVEWRSLRDRLSSSDLRYTQLYPLAAQLKTYWPFACNRGPNTETVEKYLRYTLAELRALKGFGRRKIASYIACVIHLCGDTLPQTPDTDTRSTSLKNSILFVWENTKLTKNEKAVIEQRFGIHTRKHTLEELGAVFGLTRERIRQIEKKAITKLQLSGRLAGAAEMLRVQKNQIWKTLTGSSTYIRKADNLDQLKDNLPFEIHLAIEVCADRRHRGIKRPALGDWLSENFHHDESNWYFSEEVAQSGSNPTDAHINPGLAEVISAL